MATPPSLTQIAFAGGIDESQHDEILDPTKSFLVAQNVRQDQRGGFTKRLGFVGLPRTSVQGVTRSTGRRLSQFNGAPVVIDENFLYVHSEEANSSSLRSTMAGGCSYRLMPGPGGGEFFDPVLDVEYCNGFIAVATRLGGLTVLSAGSGTTVLGRTPVSGTYTFVGSYGGRYFIAISYATAIDAYLLDTQNLAAGWTTLATVAASPAPMIPSIASLSDRVAVAFGTTSGASRVTVATYNASGLLQTRNITAGTTPTAVSVDGSVAGTLWVAFDQGTSVNVIGIDADSLSTTLATATTALTASTAVASLGICEGTTAGTALVYEVSTAAGYRTNIGLVTTVAGAASVLSSGTTSNIIPIGRLFAFGGRFYSAAAPAPTAVTVTGYVGNSQGLCVVVDWLASRPVANIEPGLVAGIWPYGKFAAVSATKRISGVFVTKRGVPTAASLASGDVAIGSILVELDLGTRKRWPIAHHNGRMFIGGGLLSVFDGEEVYEAGFLCRPTTPTTSLSAGALTGTYKYVAVYEAIDANGDITVSGVSNPVSVSPAAQNVTLSTGDYPVTCRTERTPYVVYYRTLAGGEPPYYRLIQGGVDSMSDATLATRSKLYAPNLPGTVGESQDRRAPPGLVHIASYNGMLVGAKGASLFYSGQEVYGEATWFTPLFEVPLSGAGDISGLEVLDGTLFVFREDRIYAVNGDPPTDNGAAGGLGVPRLVATDVGCVEANSIVATSLGVFFQSRRGIELLTRSGSVVWIGEAIQRTLASYPVVTSAVLDAQNSLVRFSLVASESAGVASTDGRDAVYDLTLQAWVSIDNKAGVIQGQTGTGVGSQDACMVKIAGSWRYAWLGGDGIVHYERLTSDGSAYLDDSTWITMIAETSWFKLGGLQGQQHMSRALLLARKSTDANLSIVLAYNYETTFRTATTYTGATVNTLLSGGWPITQLKHDPHDDAECQSIRVRIADATPTGVGVTVGTGKGASLLGLTLDITPKPGVFDVPEGAS